MLQRGQPRLRLRDLAARSRKLLLNLLQVALNAGAVRRGGLRRRPRLGILPLEGAELLLDGAALLG